MLKSRKIVKIGLIAGKVLLHIIMWWLIQHPTNCGRKFRGSNTIRPLIKKIFIKNRIFPPYFKINELLGDPSWLSFRFYFFPVGDLRPLEFQKINWFDIRNGYWHWTTEKKSSRTKFSRKRYKVDNTKSKQTLIT